MPRLLRTLLGAIVTLAACLAAAEAGRRVLDGYRLTDRRLVKDPRSLDLTWAPPPDQPVAALLAAIPADADTRPDWFAERPQAIVAATPAWVAERRTLGHDIGANYVWNAAAFNLASEMAYFDSITHSLDDLFAFRAADGNPRPRYRLYPGLDSGFGQTNRFGWMSRDLAIEKPRDVIRIAMLGDSTTGHYPDLVDFWLNRWAEAARLGARFEVINASRPASDALDAAAIFDGEVAAADPDIAIVYGFGNGIAEASSLIPVPPALRASKPIPGWMERLGSRAAAALAPLTPWSAAAVFLQHRLAGERGDSLAAERPKPATDVTFPRVINEDAPDPGAIAAFSGGGLMGLEQHLQALDRIDAAAKPMGTRVFVSTFRVMAYDGMVLPKGGAFYSALNEGVWWPYTYAEIARLTAFYNRTLRAWSARTGNAVMPIDEQMPRRPELYLDVMHEQPLGEALHAWIVVQQLIPVIRQDLREGRLPRHRPGAAARYSEQYWKIERIRTAEAIALGQAMNAPPPADEISGAFVLSKLAAADSSAEVVPGAMPAITTSLEPSGYAASLPMEPAMAGRMTGRGWIDVKIKVTDGRLSVGILNRAGTKFLSANGASQSPDVQDVRLPVDNLADAGRLIISNDRGQQRMRSTGQLHSVVVRRIRER